MLYPNSTPDFRIVIKQNGTTEFQVRYVCEAQGYKSKWQSVPVINEEELIG